MIHQKMNNTYTKIDIQKYIKLKFNMICYLQFLVVNKLKKILSFLLHHIPNLDKILNNNSIMCEIAGQLLC